MSEQEEALPAVVTQPERLPRERTPHVDRFRLVMAVLGGIAAGAVALAIAVASRGTQSVAQVSWSSWSPTATSSSVGTQEIAAYVAPYYRFSTAQQMDVVNPVQLTNASSAGVISGSGLTIALNYSSGSSSSSAASSQLSLLTGKTVAYNLCGVGGSANCSLPGTPSASRLLLLRREALQLALYTLHYVGSIQNIVVILPPGTKSVKKGSSITTAPQTVAVFFDRQELQPLLQSPVKQTLQTFPPLAGQANAWATSAEAGLVDQITGRGLFSIQVQSQQVGGKVMVMTPLPPQ